MTREKLLTSLFLLALAFVTGVAKGVTIEIPEGDFNWVLSPKELDRSEAETYCSTTRLAPYRLEITRNKNENGKTVFRRVYGKRAVGGWRDFYVQDADALKEAFAVEDEKTFDAELQDGSIQLWVKKRDAAPGEEMMLRLPMSFVDFSTGLGRIICVRGRLAEPKREAPESEQDATGDALIKSTQSMNT